jgi:transcription-repair coupling factor (superfamily II helicase)
MKSHVDILSLSATPIPRSLHLALSGLKKISLLTTPPPSKKPIDTIVTRWEDHTVSQAIETELARNGQIIILHNRIRSLPMIEKELENLL